MKFQKSISKWVKNSFPEKAVILPIFGHDKQATLLKFGHRNRANHVLRNNAMFPTCDNLKKLPCSEAMIGMHCPV